MIERELHLARVVKGRLPLLFGRQFGFSFGLWF
jgi:hypothetical protein